jgi:hypothetical protein
MVNHEPGKVRYARVTESITAGTVAVDVVAFREHATRVRVTHDLPAGERWLEAFDADYGAAIRDWATEIAAALFPYANPQALGTIAFASPPPRPERVLRWCGLLLATSS